MLVGTKLDLLEDQETLNRLRDRGETVVSDAEIAAMAKEIGAVAWHKCSALTQRGLAPTFQAGISAVIHGESPAWGRKGKSKSKKSVKSGGAPSAPEVPRPPPLPKQERAPWIYPANSTYGEDWKNLLTKVAGFEDIEFVCKKGKKTFKAHKIILCSSAATSLFRRVFGLLSQEEVKKKVKPISFTDINDGDVAGFESVEEFTGENGSVSVRFTLSNTIAPTVFERVLEFIYSGLATIKDKNDSCTEIRDSAKSVFGIENLVSFCENIIEGTAADFNPSIGTFVQYESGKIVKELFLDSGLWSDVSFRIPEMIQDLQSAAVVGAGQNLKSSSLKSSAKKGKAKDSNGLLKAHKLLLACRSDVIGAMFNGRFAESKQPTIELGQDAGIDVLTFQNILEYIYTDRASVDPSEEGSADPITVLQAANQYALPRLISLCELYASKIVEAATQDGIEKADFDVIGLLHLAQANNANQLAEFCLHFISNNYQPMKKRPEFSSLEGKNLVYVEEHQWPPKSYLAALEEYETKVGGTEAGKKCIVM